MKYQYILNDEIMFETDSPLEFADYLIRKNEGRQALVTLLDLQENYQIKMATT